MKARIRSRSRRRGRHAVTKRTAVCCQAIPTCKAQDLSPIEFIQAIGTRTGRKPDRAGAEELLQLAHGAKDADSLVLINVVEVTIAECVCVTSRRIVDASRQPRLDPGLKRRLVQPHQSAKRGRRWCVARRVL